MSESQSISFVRRRFATLVDLILSGILVLGVFGLDKGCLQPLYLHPTAELRSWMAEHHVDGFGDNSDMLEEHHPDMPQELKPEFLVLSKKSTGVSWAIALRALWLYHAVLEARAATPGKWLAGLVVRDRNGQKISMTRATVRLFGKLLLLTVVGSFFGVPLFLAAGYMVPSEYGGYALAVSAVVLFLLLSIRFTKKTATLYDGLAGCVVVRKAEYGPH